MDQHVAGFLTDSAYFLFLNGIHVSCSEEYLTKFLGIFQPKAKADFKTFFNFRKEKTTWVIIMK